jgi:hypothetical protein
MTLENMLNAGCDPTNIKTLQIALSKSLVDSFDDDNVVNKPHFSGEIMNTLIIPESALINYIKEIFIIDKENDIISAINGQPDKLFELDLSNTPLTKSDIDDISTKTLPWTVVFKNGQRVQYDIVIH